MLLKVENKKHVHPYRQTSVYVHSNINKAKFPALLFNVSSIPDLDMSLNYLYFLHERLGLN